MTTPRITALQRIQTLVEQDPDISQRAALRALRSEGYKIANIQGRFFVTLTKEIFKDPRITPTAQGRALVRRLLRETREGAPLDDSVLRSLAKKQGGNFRKVLQNYVRSGAAFKGKAKGKRVAINNIRYIRFTYTATVLAEVSVGDGERRQRTFTFDEMAAATTPIRFWEQSIAMDMVKTQLVRRIRTILQAELGLAIDSRADEIYINIISIDLNVGEVVAVR